MSHVQLTAYLDSVETALRQAMVTTPAPPEVKKTRVFKLAMLLINYSGMVLLEAQY